MLATWGGRFGKMDLNFSPSSRLRDRKSTRLNSSHLGTSYAVFCLKKKTRTPRRRGPRQGALASGPSASTARPRPQGKWGFRGCECACRRNARLPTALFFFNDTAPTEIYTLSLHDALPISLYSRDEWPSVPSCRVLFTAAPPPDRKSTRLNSSHLGISYAVFCLKKNSP